MTNRNKNQTADLKYREMEDFKKWRTSVINYFNDLCLKVQTSPSKENNKLVKSIQNVPKCLAHLTRKMCQCEDCVPSSLENEFEPKCVIFDLRDLALHRKHLYCDYLGLKIVNGLLLSPIHSSYNLNTKEEIYKKIDTLCYNKNYNLNKLQCAFYDLKETCKDEFDCYNFILNKKLPTNCTNLKFNEQIKEMEDDIGLDKINFNFFKDNPSQTEKNITSPFNESVVSNNITSNNNTIGIENSSPALSPSLVIRVLSLSLFSLQIFRFCKNGNYNLMFSVLGLLILAASAISCL